MDSPSLDSGAGYRSQLADARAALETMALPGYARIEAYHRQILARYEELLHNTNIDKEIRQNMAFAVEVARKFLAVRAHFEQLQKNAEVELKKFEQESMTPEQVGSRITSFMR
jgi:hypothetical protein